MNRADEVAAHLAAVRARVAVAAASAGRDASGVRIVAVTKKLDADAVRDAYAAGQRDFGENYVQEAVAKISALASEMPDARWHLIGRLQSNKAAVAVRKFHLLHGIDSIHTVAAVSRATKGSFSDQPSTISGTRDGAAELLLQVRLGGGGEGARSGVDPAHAADFLREAGAYSGVRFVGLMGVADPDQPARPQFAALRGLSGRLAALGLAHAPLGQLSMGMTGDFEDAVAEGATIVRIGAAIFGERRPG
ncbi:MAG: YggS family pyridoxal phosphate-dependent enzyme [Candidatus Binatia bacterium]